MFERENAGLGNYEMCLYVVICQHFQQADAIDGARRAGYPDDEAFDARCHGFAIFWVPS